MLAKPEKIKSKNKNAFTLFDIPTQAHMHS